VWYEVLKDKKLIPAESVMLFDSHEMDGGLILPMSLLRPLLVQFPDLNILGLTSNSDVVFHETKASQILIDKVIDSMSILMNTRYKSRLESVNIKYAKFTDECVLGLAYENNIYLSTKLDCEDVNMISKIIIEENEHNRSGLGDKTRAFQNHLFNLYFDELIN
jgi:hypothetical protein